MKVTNKQLEKKAEILNEITGNPKTQFTRVNGKLTPNKGNYHISQESGGVMLCQMASDTDFGVNNVLRLGSMTKRELYYMIDAYIQGIQLDKELCGVIAIVTVVRDNVIDSIEKFNNVANAEKHFIEQCRGNISNFDEYGQKDIALILEQGYEKFGHGSICISWV